MRAMDIRYRQPIDNPINRLASGMRK